MIVSYRMLYFCGAYCSTILNLYYDYCCLNTNFLNSYVTRTDSVKDQGVLADSKLQRKGGAGSDRSGNFGYPSLGDTGVAILQGRNKLSSATTIKLVATCRSAYQLSCVQGTSIFVCFQGMKVFTGKQTSFTYAAIFKFVADQYTAFE